MNHCSLNEEIKRRCSQQLTTESNVVERFKCFLLKTYGCCALRCLSKKFQIMDDSGDRKLSLDEFTDGMRDVLKSEQFKLTRQDIIAVFAYFDKDGSGAINFDEFLLAIRPKMNKARTRLVRMVFFKIAGKSSQSTAKKQEQEAQQQQKLLKAAQRKLWGEDWEELKESDDRDKSHADTIITVEDLMNEYDVRMHPKFINGEWSKQQVLLEFLKNFEMGGSVDGKVTLDEFLNYYAAISASIDDDNYFSLMLLNAWKVKVKPTDKETDEDSTSTGRCSCNSGL